MGDPGLPGLAFCSAAWQVPGVSATAAPASMATPCARQPAALGRSASGASCSVEDNCAAGWHVCSGDSDVTAHGLTSELCDGFDNQRAFFTTREPAMAVLTDQTRPPACGPTGATRLVGCGSLLGRGTTGCATLTRSLGIQVVLPAFLCDASANIGWLCGGTVFAEAVNVTKPRVDHGGVICCRDSM
jgi:hypothetical protein